ncbi:ABC transporter permease [Motiliproteus sp. SC1-56]|uniref:ABC transporter permease n=1 Tax=Motiliproteus sp. SC1-56 TaxID=2799565 RepID=UPI001A8E0897|nr:FtsX-like permease family protein [Motiliproteus sp. SC1-56]
MNARLALRLLLREWRGGELRLLLVALCIAVTASCAVGFFTDRVERALLRQATEFLGADLVLRTARPFPADLAAQARQRGLNYSEQLQFPSMLIHGEQMLLASIKAVDDRYPLKGQPRVAAGPGEAGQPRAGGPAPGTLWVEPRILQSLALEVGDELELGAARLQVAGVLTHEPDRGGGLFSLRPRALMHQQDLAATQVIQPGSRLRYRYLFSGPDAALEPFRAWLKPQLVSSQRLLDIAEENPSLGATLSRARTYLNLAGLLAVIMAGVAVAMTARRFSERHFDSAALLRCFGQSQRQILFLFALQLVLAGVAAALAGVALGWLTQFGLVQLLSGLLPAALPPAGVQPGLTGFATGLLVLGGFALPPLLRLSRVSPLRVLRRELSPLPPSAWLVYGLAALLILGLLWSYSGDLQLTLLLALGGTGGALLLGLVGWGLLRLAARIPGPLAWRMALKNLLRQPRASLGQLLAFGLTLAAMALILVVRNDLMSNWQQQLPENAPNYFLINVQPQQVAPLREHLDARGITHSGLYPMVRGRLSKLNGEDADTLLSPLSPGRRAIRRELNLTFSDTLAPDNRILEGRWWQPQDRGQPLISLEQGLAADLGVGVGDRLGFRFGERELEARITSVRSLEWGSMRPNFYVIFPPGGLADLPATYITSFYLPAERQAEIAPLMRAFPTLTLLEVDRLLANIRDIIDQVALAVEYVLLFVLAAGLTVLFAALAATLDERLDSGALMRALGTEGPLLRRLQGLEFALLGALAGLLATVLVEGISFWLYRLLELRYQPSVALWLALPLAGALLVGGAGLLGTRRVVRQSPLKVLREH